MKYNFTDLQGLPIAINDSGQILLQNGAAAYLYSHGTFKPISDPAIPGGVTVSGLNNLGDVVGYTYASDGTGIHPFLYQADNYVEFAYPNASSTSLLLLAENGQVLGTSSAGAFLYKDGGYTTLDGLPTSNATIGDV